MKNIKKQIKLEKTTKRKKHKIFLNKIYYKIIIVFFVCHNNNNKFAFLVFVPLMCFYEMTYVCMYVSMIHLIVFIFNLFVDLL